MQIPLTPDMGQHFAILVGDPMVVGPDSQTFITDPDGNTVELHQVGIA